MPQDIDYEALDKTVVKNGGLFASLDLIEKTTKRNVKGYLDWRASRMATKPTPPGATADATALVKTLKSINLGDSGDLFANLGTLKQFAPYKLATAVKGQVQRTLLLLADGADGLIPPETAPSSSKRADDRDMHPLYLGLSTTTTTTTKDPARPSVPRIVLPLGRLVWEDVAATTKSSDDDEPTLVETNYHMVVDVLAKGNPVWLIYNRYASLHSVNDNYAGDDDEARPRVEALDPASEPPVFDPAISNVDSVCVFDGIAAWPTTPTTVRQLTANFGRGGLEPVKGTLLTHQEVAEVLVPAA
ncbi:hypothetical protein B0T24DRAFT_626204 [Lasiosphaeria ovina]|uniref:Uncharacterized protein n=1 Tax=Lasiosphaeria ovina TaxID=92902 RepID=A0AAE0KD74_9PEZI|nr:hypothetical protein B0T24DRAFT_626204 [Lasiosphaeria ovina]